MRVQLTQKKKKKKFHRRILSHPHPTTATATSTTGHLYRRRRQSLRRRRAVPSRRRTTVGDFRTESATLPYTPSRLGRRRSGRRRSGLTTSRRPSHARETFCDSAVGRPSERYQIGVCDVAMSGVPRVVTTAVGFSRGRADGRFGHRKRRGERRARRP